MADLFDPADQEIGPELVVGNDTPESAYIPDTNGDPDGAEKRAVQANIPVSYTHLTLPTNREV